MPGPYRLTQFFKAVATRSISFELDLIPLHFERLPLYKICNWALTESSVAFKPARPWGCPTVHWSGTVCSCFMDYNEKRPLGSLETQSFREIWHGDPYTELRHAFRRSWELLAPCGQCASGYLGGNVGRQANSEAYYFS